MPPQVAQRGQGTKRAVVLGFLVDPITLAKAVGPSVCVVADGAKGTETLPGLLEVAHRGAGFDAVSQLVLVGYSAGCQRVRALCIAGANPAGVLLVDGTHASWPPEDWQIAWLKKLAGDARKGNALCVATHTMQTYTESLVPPLQPYASTVRVLRMATGFTLDKQGTIDAPVVSNAGSLWVYSYQSARIDGEAHRKQGQAVLPALAKKHLAPLLAGTPGPTPPTSGGDGPALPPVTPPSSSTMDSGDSGGGDATSGSSSSSGLAPVVLLAGAAFLLTEVL